MREHYFTQKPKSKLKLGMVKTWLRGSEFKFFTASGTFSPKRIDNGTLLLIDEMVLPEEGTILDLGCGYGPVGIAAARLRPRAIIYMTDVNSRAIGLANDNARTNNVKNVRILEGSLYEPVSRLLFDVILTNPPIAAGIGKVVAPMIRSASGYLKEGGSLQLVVRSSKGGENICGILEESFRQWEVLARRGGYRVLKAEC